MSEPDDLPDECVRWREWDRERERECARLKKSVIALVLLGVSSEWGVAKRFEKEEMEVCVRPLRLVGRASSWPSSEGELK